MKILVGGGSGFIGKALCDCLREAGHEVVVISRTEGDLSWDQLRAEGLPECDGVINLAGANILKKKWTPDRKRLLFSSRIDTTRLLANLIEKAEKPPKVFVQASAIGYYSGEGQTPQTEESPPGGGFLAKLCQQWEGAGLLPEGHPTRLVVVRIGLVLALDGGALQQMLTPFRLGLGGRVGPGEQGFSWIHRDDLTGLFLWALENDHLSGVVNGVAPECVSQGEFAKALGRALHRPACLPMPAWVVRILFGERGTALLKSPYVAPERTLAQGYRFVHPKLDEALVSLVQ